MLNIIKWRIKIYSDNRILIILFLIIPIILTFWLSEDINKKEIGPMVVNVIDEDESDLSREYINRLENDESITTEKLPYEKAVEYINKEKISSMILIKKGFSDNLLEGSNKDLMEFVYLKDNYYVSLFSDVFVHHYFPYLSKYRNINYVFKNYGDLIDEDEYIERYENNYKQLNSLDSYKYNFSLIEVDAAEGFSQNNKNTLLYRYLLGVIFLLSYILIFIQSIEFYKNKKGIAKKIKLSGINWIKLASGNIIGVVIPTFLILSLQLILVNLIINKDFNFNIILFSLIFTISIVLITVVIVRLLKKSESLYLMIPYYIIVLWIFGNVLFNLEFISFLDMERNIIPGVGIKDIITSFFIGTKVDIWRKLLDELIYIGTMIAILGVFEYKEFKNALS